MVDIGSMAIWLAIEGYDYGAIGSYALQWDCSIDEAIIKLFQRINEK